MGDFLLNLGIAQIAMATYLNTFGIGDMEGITYSSIAMFLLAGFEIVDFAESIREMHLQPTTARVIAQVIVPGLELILAIEDTIVKAGSEERR